MKKVLRFLNIISFKVYPLLRWCHWDFVFYSIALLLLLFSCSVVSDSFWPHELQKAFLSFTISWSFHKLMSVECMMPSNHLTHFSPCPQFLPASGSFPMSQPFASGGQSIGVPASTSVLPVNTQDWSPLGLTDWISLQSKRLLYFSNTPVQKHQFFSAQLSL